MQALRRPPGGLNFAGFDSSSAHAASREFSSKRRQAPPPVSYPMPDVDMEGDEDMDEHAAAAGALLALQTATHVSPSGKRAPALQRPSARGQRSPTGAAPEAATGAASRGQYGALLKPEDGRMSSSLPGDFDAAEQQQQQQQQLEFSRVHGHSHKGGLQEPQTSNNIASGSCGSAKDTFVGASQEADLLEDMEVTVVSETEKGCQVWFPPLPNEMEMRRRRRGSETTGAGTKRKYSAYQVQGHDSAGVGEDCEAGACSQGPDDDLDMPGPAVGPASAHRGGGGRGSMGEAAEVGQSGGSTPRGTAEAGGNKRQRFIWTHELHERFVAAVQQLGVKTAVPKAILTLMKVEGMTRENVASHLQKFRMALRRMEMQQQQPGGANSSGRPGRAHGSNPQDDYTMLSHAAKFTSNGGSGGGGPAPAAASGGTAGGQDAGAPAPRLGPAQGVLLERLAETSRKQAAAQAAAAAAAATSAATPASAPVKYEPETQHACAVSAAVAGQAADEPAAAAHDAAAVPAAAAVARGASPAPMVIPTAAHVPLNFTVLSPELLSEARSVVSRSGQASPAAAALASAAGFAKPNAAVAAAAMAALAQQQGQALQLVAGGGRLPVALQQHGQVLQLVAGAGVAGFQVPLCYSLQPLNSLQGLAVAASAADLDPAAAAAAATAHFAGASGAAAAAAAATAAPIALVAAPVAAAASAQIAAALPAAAAAAAAMKVEAGADAAA